MGCFNVKFSYLVCRVDSTMDFTPYIMHYRCYVTHVWYVLFIFAPVYVCGPGGDSIIFLMCFFAAYISFNYFFPVCYKGLVTIITLSDPEGDSNPTKSLWNVL